MKSKMPRIKLNFGWEQGECFYCTVEAAWWITYFLFTYFLCCLHPGPLPKTGVLLKSIFHIQRLSIGTTPPPPPLRCLTIYIQSDVPRTVKVCVVERERKGARERERDRGRKKRVVLPWPCYGSGKYTRCISYIYICIYIYSYFPNSIMQCNNKIHD